MGPRFREDDESKVDPRFREADEPGLDPGLRRGDDIRRVWIRMYRLATKRR